MNSLKGDAKSRCVAFREVIPWERIAELLSNWENWLFDPKMVPIIVEDYRTNYPTIKEGKRNRYQMILNDEIGASSPHTKLTEEDMRKAGV